MTEHDETTTPAVNRRVVLAGAGAVGAAGLLAACSSGNTTSSEVVPTAAPETPAATNANAVAETSQVPVSGGLVIDDKQLVVTQPKEGQFKAFTSICPHQGCTVGEVTADAIICPCHGSEFSPETGEVLMGPAMTGLTPVAIKVKGTEIIAEA